MDDAVSGGCLLPAARDGQVNGNFRECAVAARRYEALRAYFIEDMPASEIADRSGYSTASVHQMATLLRAGRG